MIKKISKKRKKITYRQESKHYLTLKIQDHNSNNKMTKNTKPG